MLQKWTSQYYSLNWADREGIITGDKYTNFRARMNVKTEITSFLSVGMNAQFSSRNEGFLKCLWEQMTMISPYGANEVDNLESPYRRNRQEWTLSILSMIIVYRKERFVSEFKCKTVCRS